MKHLLHINGLDGPLLRQFGCECGRCLGPDRQANTSASLLSLDDAGHTAHHLLFDAGHGVVDSLNDSPYLQGPAARLDGIALTHWHPDHVAELNRLCVAEHHNRRRRGRRAGRVPLYARAGTVAWLAREQSHVLRTYLEPRLPAESEPPGTLLPPLPLDLPGVRVTPVSIGHYTADIAAGESSGGDQTVFSTAAYVIATERAKAVLLWDIDSENEWLAAPDEARATALDLLAGADFLLIDTTFWHRPRHRVTHPSFENVLRYARMLKPRRTLLMHLSGHPDGPGNPGYGWTNAEWTAAASRIWAASDLTGTVMAPSVGMAFEL